MVKETRRAGDKYFSVLFVVFNFQQLGTKNQVDWLLLVGRGRMDRIPFLCQVEN